MRLTIRGFIATTTGALLTVLAGAPAFADDTEIFFSKSSAGAAANILMILDTSGSMNDLVTSTQPYDPSQTYTPSKCTTAFDTNYVYYAAKGVPACSSTNKLNPALIKCAAMGDLAKSTSGYFPGIWVQWGSSASSSSSGSGKNKTTVKTTTYAWKSSLSTTNTTGYIECSVDAGVDGDGSDTTLLYPSTDKFSATVTYDYLNNVIATSPLTAGQQTGVWDTSAKNYWAAASGVTYTFYSANYLNYYYDATQTTSKSKMSIMQQAATGMLNSVSGVNVGLMRYNYGGSGGMVLWPASDIATNKSSMTTLINNWAPAGITPLSETLYEAYLYYSGGAVDFGLNSTTANCTSWNSVNGQCLSATSAKAPSVTASRTSGGGSYDSPADNSCQKNYILYLTDGLPNEASQADTAIQKLGVTCDTTVFSGANGGKCTAALAGYMYNNDMRPTDVTGKQNVTSYFIGFGKDFVSNGQKTPAANYLDAAAKAGGTGQALTATTLNELTDVFTEIFSSVMKTNTTFSAPAVAVDAFNRTQTLNDLYFSVFSPQGTYHWPGNVKKYKVVDGDIVDQTGAGAVDVSKGFFAESAQSFWSAAVDGNEVTKGGAASNIPDPSKRIIYTYKGSNPSSAAAMTQFSASTVNDADLNIGGATDPSLADLVNWTLGMDVKDVNGDNDTTDARHAMGDPIHTQPTVVIYGKTTDTNNKTIDDTVVYVPTNDGYFHAIDGNTGQELWAFIPQEMFQYLKLLYANDTASTKHYGLDGTVAILKYDINGDGTIDASAGDKVFLYFGTGRNSDMSRYYALDVTDKQNPKYMWSIDASVMPGLGQSWAAPQITRANISGATQNSQKLALVISGGYDAVEDNTTYVASDSVGNHIYMVDALYGTLLWSAGSTSGNLVVTRMDHAIPSAVTVVDLDSDGYADRMYVGDMAGQLWRFDIWNNKTVSSFVTGGVIASLGAKDESSKTNAVNRRFYNSPDVAAVVKPGASPYLNIAIGSGYRGHPLDLGTSDVFYSIRDTTSPFGKIDQTTYNSLTPIVDFDNANSAMATASKPVDITNTAAPTIPAGSVGWELKMSQKGEKILASSRTFDGDLFFPSYTPANSTAQSTSCTGVGAGTNREYIVSIYDGSPAIDKNKDGTKTTDERTTDLAQTGIAPETAFLFLEGDTPGQSEVIGLSADEKVLDTNFKQLRKTYWHEQNGN